MINVAFVGNPNVGKTALINKISNTSLKVGNWPGVTIEKKEIFFKVGNEDIKLIDLPGIYNLSTETAEERVARDFLLKESVDVIINVVDSTSLERNLYLTAMLKELGKPVVMALNFSDEFEKLGFQLDLEVFQKQLNIPVIFTSGRTGAGIKELMENVVNVSKQYRGQTHIPYRLTFEDILEESILSVKEKLEKDSKYAPILKKYSPDWVAIKALEEDTNALAMLKSEFGENLMNLASEERKNIENHLKEEKVI